MNQSFLDFEIIVVDDGSPNNEAEQVCKTFEKVNYVRIENSGGPAKPRNIGIQKAKGKYIAFVDDDDIWLPTKLEKQVNVLEQNPDFGLVHGCCEVINEEGLLQGKIIGRPGNPEVKHGDVKMRMIGNWTVMMPTSFIRKEIVHKVGYFNENMPSAGEDTEYWTRCSFQTKFYYLDEPLVFYRIHNTNISSKNEGYLFLPLYLKNILQEQCKKEIISKKDYNRLINNLIQFQIRTLSKNRWLVIKNIFKINTTWFLYYKNVICFIKFFTK